MEWMSMKKIITTITQNYNLQIYSTEFVRKMIGVVYKLIGKDTDYILKLYTEDQIGRVKETLKIIRYLYEQNVNSLDVIRSVKQEDFIAITVNNINYFGVVFTYHHGIAPNTNLDYDNIIKHMKLIHDKMNNYPNKLHYLGKLFYVNRCIELLLLKDYNSAKLIDLTYMANELYHYIEELPRTFCHGDFHNKNIIKGVSGELTLIDFDAANNASNLIDVATFCDQTDFNQLKHLQFENTIEALQDAQQQYRKFSRKEMKAMMAFIPIRHLELIATIGNAQGLAEIKKEFIEEQFGWVKQYFEYFLEWIAKL